MPIPTNVPREPSKPRPNSNSGANNSSGLPDMEELMGRYSDEPARKEQVSDRVPYPNPRPQVEDEDVFTPISANDDSLYEDDDEKDFIAARPTGEKVDPHGRLKRSTLRNSEIFDQDDEEDSNEVAAQAQQRKVQAAAKKKELPPGYTEDTFIDHKKGMLKPFGRDSGRKAKVNEFDQRKNLRQRSKIVQVVALAGIAALVLLGIKNALIPPKTLNEEDVAGIVAVASGDTGFPTERGGAFAVDFIKAYLSFSSDPKEKNKYQEMMNFFYSGSTTSAGTNVVRINKPSNVGQKIVMGPTIYSSTPLSPSSASYVIGAFVEHDVKDSSPPEDGSSVKISYFNVNVYYNEENESFAITSDSPSVVAPTNIAVVETPEALPIGTGPASDQITNEVKSVVDGFIKAYGESSIKSHEQIDQYIVADPDPSLVSGLNGRYQLRDESITQLVYTTADPNEFKVETEVVWIDTLSATENNEQRVTYNSSYIVTLAKQSNGKYLVSKFAPKYYFANTSSN